MPPPCGAVVFRFAATTILGIVGGSSGLYDWAAMADFEELTIVLPDGYKA